MSAVVNLAMVDYSKWNDLVIHSVPVVRPSDAEIFCWLRMSVMMKSDADLTCRSDRAAVLSILGGPSRWRRAQSSDARFDTPQTVTIGRQATGELRSRHGDAAQWTMSGTHPAIFATCEASRLYKRQAVGVDSRQNCKNNT